jgi:hypothetical protein
VGRRLFVTERRNRLTGRQGLVVGDDDARKAFDMPGGLLAELPSSNPAELDEDAKQRFHWTVDDILKNQISLVIHKPFSGTWAGATAFACRIRNEGDSQSFSYRVCLFLDEEEAAQWTE